MYKETREHLDAIEAREATKYIYSNISEVNFSVENSRKRIVGLNF